MAGQTRRSGRPRLAAAAVGIAVLLGLFLLTDSETLAASLRTLDLAYLALSLLAFGLGTCLRAYRFKILAGSQRDVSLKPFYRITAYHQLLLMLLPFRTGEFSYPILLRQQLQRPLAKGTGDLVVARLLDLILCGSCLGLGLLALPVEGNRGAALTTLSLVVVSLGAAGLALLPKLVHFCQISVARWRPRLSPEHFRAGEEFILELDRATSGLEWRVLASALGVSLAAGGAAILRIYLLFASFQVDLGALGATFLFGAANLIGLIPLHGFGGLGPKQLGIAGALVLLGLSTALAASLTLLFQAAMIAFVALLALLAYGLPGDGRDDRAGGTT